MNKNFFDEELLKPQKKNITQIQKMNKEIKEICSLLIKNSDEFDNDSVEKVVKQIEEYIKKYDRIAYSVMSNFIFSLSSQTQGTMTTNFDLVVEWVLSNKYEKEFKRNIKTEESNISLEVDDDEVNKIWKEAMDKQYRDEQYSRIRKTIIKMYDHIQLAIHQFENLKQDDNEFRKKFISNIEPVKTEVNNQLNDFTKGMNSQLISLVGIFTAMSFLVFGGINSLDNIFQEAKTVPILQIMIIGSVWGLCITNLVFVFMFFISKMTGLNIKSCGDKGASLVQKYPLVFWSDLIILTILALCSWLYYIDIKNIGGWFINIGQKNPCIISILGLIIIVVTFFIFSFVLMKKYKKTTLELNVDKKNKINPKSIDKNTYININKQ